MATTGMLSIKLSRIISTARKEILEREDVGLNIISRYSEMAYSLGKPQALLLTSKAYNYIYNGMLYGVAEDEVTPYDAYNRKIKLCFNIDGCVSIDIDYDNDFMTFIFEISESEDDRGNPYCDYIDGTIYSIKNKDYIKNTGIKEITGESIWLIYKGLTKKERAEYKRLCIADRNITMTHS